MSFFRKVYSIEIVKNIMILFSGAFVAQLFPIIVSPMLTRLYTPEMFGVFSLFFSISVILSSFSTGKYELAILLPKRDSDSVILFFLAIGLSIFTNIIFLVVLLFWKEDITTLLKSPFLKDFLFLCPIFAFILSIYLSNQYLANRKKNYKDITQSKIIQASSLTVFQLSLSLLNTLGLIVGYILGVFLSSILLIRKNFYSYRRTLINWNRFFYIVEKYKKFPLVFNFSYGLNTLIMNFSPIIIIASFGVDIAGLYLLVQRSIATPIGMISSSISSVFFQKATTQKDCRKLYLTISLGLFFLGLPFVIFLYLYAPMLFEYIFGADWRDAGEMASIMVISYWLSVSTNSVSQFSTIYQKALYNMLWQTSLLCSMVIAWYMGSKENDIFLYLKIFVTCQCFLYIIGYFYEYYLCVKQAKGIDYELKN